MTNTEQQILYVFPGQGSQYKGMGSDLFRDFASARRIYGEAKEVLGFDIETLSFEDPDQQLDLTRYTQPALLTHEIACLEIFREQVGSAVSPGAAAGHSLGEYTALVAADALTFEDALYLVQKRGEFMGTYGEGKMLATPLELESAQSLAEKHYCEVASHNLPEQTVVGGAADDIAALSDEFATLYPSRVPVQLQTEGAFHTYFMINAARHFRVVLNSIQISTPKFQVLSNYTGGYHDSDAQSIKARLFFQLFRPVNWVGCLKTATDSGMSTFIEFGGGIGRDPEPEQKRPNLAGIIKKTLRRSGVDGRHLPAINSATIQKTATVIAGLG
jgi:[acyl-carrier-protein] S-malonyltransferase